jgi:hypothetical protein
MYVFLGLEAARQKKPKKVIWQVLYGWLGYTSVAELLPLAEQLRVGFRFFNGCPVVN